MKESMSSIMKKMQQVPEAGLHKQGVVAENTQKPLVNNSNSMTNHLRAFSNVQGEIGNNNNPEPTTQQTQKLTEDNKMKMIGGLQVVKELLEGDLSKEPEAILQRVKTILGNF